MTDREIEKLYGNFTNAYDRWNYHKNKAQTLHDAGSQFDSAFFGAGALAANKHSPVGGVLNIISTWTDKTYRKHKNDKRITAKSIAHRRAQAQEIEMANAEREMREAIGAIKQEYYGRVKQNAAANYKNNNYMSQLFR